MVTEYAFIIKTIQIISKESILSRKTMVIIIGLADDHYDMSTVDGSTTALPKGCNYIVTLKRAQSTESFALSVHVTLIARSQAHDFQYTVSTTIESTHGNWSFVRTIKEYESFNASLIINDNFRGLNMPKLPKFPQQAQMQTAEFLKSKYNEYTNYLKQILHRSALLGNKEILDFIQSPKQIRRTIATLMKFESIPIKCGCMKKEGEKWKGYKLRYFVLSPSYILRYYEDENAYKNCQTSKGLIDLTLAEKITVSDDDKANIYAFDIETKSRIWKLQCESKSDRDEWVDSLNNLLQKNTFSGFIAEYKKKEDIDWNALIDENMNKLNDTQRIRTLQKLKIITSKMMNHTNGKMLVLDKSKFFDNTLDFLYALGFAQDLTIENHLICDKVDADLIKQCDECLDDKLDQMTKKETKNVRLSVFEPFVNIDNEYKYEQKEQSADKKEEEILWDEYVGSYGTPQRAENFMLWAKRRGTSIKFKDANALIRNKGYSLLDMHKKEEENEHKNNGSLKEEKDKSMMKGPKRQFYKFLAEHRLEKYFDKFEEMNCCNIADVEYLDDDNFLKKEIGINHPIERRRLIGECKKFKKQMSDFSEIGMSVLLKRKLDSLGIVTREILSKEARSKVQLRAKFGLNDEQSDLLWNVIENGYQNVDEMLMEDEEEHSDESLSEEQEEGISNIEIEHGVDTLVGHKVENNVEQNENVIDDVETPYL